MSQPHLIVKNTVALGSARILERGVSACLSFFVARYLGPSALGVYSAAIVFLALISLIAEMGSATFLTREIARDRTRTGPYALHFMALTLLVSSGVIAVAMLVIPRLGYSRDLKASLYIIVFASIPAVLRIIQEAIFLAHQRAEFIIWSTVAGAVLNISASLICLERDYGIAAIVLVFTTVQYVMTIMYLVFLCRYICPLPCHFSFRFAWTLISQVRAFTGSSILGGLLARPEVIILSLLGNDVQIGYYSAALRIVDLWGVIPETYMKNVFPVLSHAYLVDRGRCQIILERSIKFLLAISLPLMSGICVAARPLIRLLYGSGFAPSVPVLRVLACCIPLAFLFELLWRLLAARDQQYLMLRAQIIIAFLRLTGGYLLITRLASLGAALSASVFLAGHVLLLGLYARRDGTRLRIYHVIWRLSLAATGMAAVTAVFIERWQLWLAALLAGMLYVAMVFVLKALSPADLAVLRKVGQVRTAA